MTISNVIDKIFGDKESRCMWQFCPHELPEDAPAMALELWQTEDGVLHLVQLLIDGVRGGDWYNRISSFVHFVQKKENG